MKAKHLIPLLLVLLLSFGVYAREAEPLKVGSKGEAVVRLQTRLKDLGYNNYKATGSFQALTERIVRHYQAASGLSANGSMDSHALTLLYSEAASIEPFAADIPLSFTAQDSYLPYKGSGVLWAQLKGVLQVGNSYTLTNCADGSNCRLQYIGGENHGEFSVPANALSTVQRWLGSGNSFYKIAVLVTVEEQQVAASIQWDGSQKACVYFNGSCSHVNGLTDIEHETLVRSATLS